VKRPLLVGFCTVLSRHSLAFHTRIFGLSRCLRRGDGVKGGLLHLHFEGYYIKYRHDLASRTDIVAEVWKEYALSDSRYLSKDPFVVSIEALTVVSGIVRAQ
jgi:hypothetical protein